MLNLHLTRNKVPENLHITKRALLPTFLNGLAPMGLKIKQQRLGKTKRIFWIFRTMKKLALAALALAIVPASCKRRCAPRTQRSGGVANGRFVGTGMNEEKL